MSRDNLPSRADGEIASLYYNGVGNRERFLSRARDCAKLTIPTLVPPSGTTGNQKFLTPYQSIGARAVNHLASKLILSLFPPNQPFFRMVIDDFQLEELTQSKEARGPIEKALAKIERSICADVETSALRVPIHLGIKHLIVAGNILLYRDPKTGRGRAIPLSNYIVRRDTMGNVLEIVVMEEIAPVALPEAVREAIQTYKPEALPSRQADYDRSVALFTRICRKEKEWEVVQECEGVLIEETRGTYKLDQCPFLPLRMVVVDGEDYGRSLVEEYYGDLNTLEKLTKAVVQFAGAAAKIVFLVKPNATTKARVLAKAESGDFVTGQKEDIDVLQLEKYADFQVVQSVLAEITQRLMMAFLMNSAVQRNAERVTAEEIRLMAQELDSGFGGIHANLSQELQLPLVNMIMESKQKAKKLPPLPSGFIKPSIVTGIDALGRSLDFQNLNMAIATVIQLPGVAERLKPQEMIDRVFSAANVNPDGLFISEEEMQVMQQQQQMQAMAQQVAPTAAKAVITEGMKPQ